MYQNSGSEGFVRWPWCVWDVLERRVHHHGCEQARAVCQARGAWDVHCARVHHQRNSARSLLQAWRRHTVCVRASRLHHQSKRTRTLQEARWNHFQTMPSTRLPHPRKSARPLLQARCIWGVPRTRLHLQSACARMVQEARQPVQFQEMKLCSCTMCRLTVQDGAHI